MNAGLSVANLREQALTPLSSTEEVSLEKKQSVVFDRTVIQAKVDRILRGEIASPQYAFNVNDGLAFTTLIKCCDYDLDIKMHQRYNLVLDNKLAESEKVHPIECPIHTVPYAEQRIKHTSKRITRQEFDQWQQEAKAIKLQDDDFVLSLGQQPLSQVAVDLGKEFQAQGPFDFEWSGLDVVLNNIQLTLTHKKMERNCFLQKQMQDFIDIIKNFTKQNSKLPYLSVHFFCFQYNLLMVEYYAGLSAPEQQKARQESVATIIGLNHERYVNQGFRKLVRREAENAIYGNTVYSIYSKIMGLNAREETLSLNKIWINLISNLIFLEKLLLPTFEPLSCSFLVNSQCHNIAPAGLLAGPLAFPDNNLTTSFGFFDHDVAHTMRIPSRAIEPERKYQILHEQSERVKLFHIGDDTRQAIERILFTQHHEDWHPSIRRELKGIEKEVPLPTCLTQRVIDYSPAAQIFALDASFHDDLNETLEFKHLYAAVTILNAIEPCLPREDEHP